MRTFFITDIHGHHDEFICLLAEAKFNPAIDHLVVGGDMINRGKQSGEVLKTIFQLHQTYPNNIHPICGNHEEMVRFYIHGRSKMWMLWGGYESMSSISRVFPNKKEFEDLLQWIDHLPLTYSNDSFFFVHAGFDPLYKIKSQSRDILWMEKREFYSFTKEELSEQINDKIVVHGHTPTSKVIFDGIRLSCDLGAGTVEIPKLGLVDLTNQITYIYDIRQQITTIESCSLKTS